MVSKEPFYQYIDGVLSGKQVVGRLQRLAVERFVKDTDKKDYNFNYQEGIRIVNFAALCRHWKGAKTGTPIIFDPYQHFYLIQKYGWQEPVTKLPRFRRSYKQVGRKNAKTTELAIESLFHVIYGVEEAAQVWTCANKEDDAIIVVNDAGRISEVSPALRGKFKYQIRDPYIRRVIYPKRNAFMAFMTKGQDAVDTSFGIGDECHDWATANVKNRIESSMGNRIAPSFSNATTAGFNKFGYCFQTLRAVGIKILEGSIIDDQQLIDIHELDEGDDWQDRSVWPKANPLMHSSTTIRPYLETEFTKAKNNGGTDEVNFKTKNLNMWTDAASVWIQDETWMKSAPGISEDQLKESECFAGLYTAGKETVNCFVLYFPEVVQRDGQSVTAFLVWSWIPESFVSKNSDNMDYKRWVDSGHLTVTPGNEADHRIIAKDIIGICERYLVRVVGFDKTFGQYVAPDLEAEGIPVMEINQSFNNLGQQTEELRAMVKAGRVEHFQNPIIRWHISNTTTHRNRDGVEKPDKQASGSRIGSVAAILNAMAARFILVKEGVMDDFSFK